MIYLSQSREQEIEMRYVLYCKAKMPTDEFSRMYVPIYTEAHKARTFLEEFIGPDEYTREGTVITLHSGAELKAEFLDDILAAKLEGWELPALDSRRILRFKYGSWDGMSIKPRLGTEPSEPKPERDKRPEKPQGFVTITELAQSWGILPMHARAALRNSGREKPAYGWAFDPKEAEAIKRICVENGS
jgi:hypothetical protein